MTIVESVNADGSFVIAPVIILTGRQILLRWFDNITEECIAVNDTGYMNQQLAYQWIQHFNHQTKGRTTGKYRLLLCDGLSAHITREFIQFCEKNDIILYFLPPHSSHKLQPLDVGVFNVYKHWHSEAVEAATMSGCTKFTKDLFLQSIRTIRRRTFKPSTIKLGYRLTGLWPYNPSIVCDDLADYSVPLSPLPDSPSSSASSIPTDISTPTTTSRFRRIEKKLDRLDKNSTTFQNTLQKLMKGSQIQAHLAIELRRELNATTHAQSIREAQRNTSGRRVRLSGIISSKNVLNMKRQEKELDDLEALDRLRPRWKKVMKELRMQCKRQGRRLRR